MEKLRNTRILGLIGCVCLLVGVFMPYLTFSFFGFTESFTLWMSWEGKVILILAILELLFIFKDILKKYLPQLFQSSIGQKIENLNVKMSLVITILIAVLALILTINTIDGMDLDLGFWIFWIGIICLVGHALLYKEKQHQLNSIYQQSMQDMGMQTNYNQPVNQQVGVQSNYSQPINQQVGVQSNYNQPINQQVGVQSNYNQPMNQQVGVQSNYNQPMNQDMGTQAINYGQSQNISSTVNFCPSCGNKVDESTKKCLGCGKQF